MTKKIRKFFTIGGYEKEEEWLNEMSSKGYLLKEVGFYKYLFEEGAPNEYTYRIELLDDIPTTEKNVQYIDFLKSIGIDVVGSYSRWIYLRRRNDGIPFEMFSDLDSKINHYKKIIFLGNSLTFFELWILMMQFLNVYNLYNDTGTLINLLYSFTFIFIFLIISAIIFIQIVIYPIRKSLDKLLKEKSIRE